MANELGTIAGQIVLDIRQAAEQYTKLRQDHLSTVSALGAGETALRAVGQGFMRVGQGLGAGLVSAALAAGEFERKLDYFVAVGGPDAVEMYDEVHQKVLELGKDTIYSADEIAESFIELAKAGVPVRDTVDYIGEAVANLGAAADMPLEEAAIGLTTILNSFGIEAENAIRVTDQLAGSANSSSIEVQDLLVTMRFAAASAKTAGLEFEDVNAAIALLGERGIRGSRAGTGLRQMFDKLIAPTNKGAKALRELGIITEDGANKLLTMDGTLRPIPELVSILNGELDGMATNEKMDILGNIFPITSLPVILNLLDAGADGLNRLNDEINKTTALDVASARLDNLSGDIEYLSGELETLQIRIGEAMGPVARSLVQWAEDVIMAFNNLPDSAIQVIVTLAAVAAGVLIFIGAAGLFSAQLLNMIQLAYQLHDVFLSLGKQWPKLIKLVGGFKKALMVPLSNPFILLLVAIAAALTYFFTQTEAGQEMWGRFVDQFMATMAALEPQFNSLSSAFGNLIDTLLPLIVEIAGAVMNGLMIALEALLPVIEAVGSGFITGLGWALELILPALTWLVELLTGPLGGVLIGLVGVVLGIVGAIRLWSIAQAILNVAMSANPIGIIIMAIAALVAAIIWVATETTFFQDVWAAVSSFFIDVWTNVSNFFIEIWNNIVSFVTDVWNNISSFFTSTWQSIADFFIGIWTAVSDVFMDIWNGMVEFLTPIFEFIYGIIKFYIEAWINLFLIIAAVFVTIWRAVSLAFQVVWNAIVAFFTPIIDWIVQVITNAVNFIRDVWNTVWGAVSSFFTDVWNGIVEFLTPIIDFIVLFITTGIAILLATWNEVWGNISSFFTDIWNGIVGFVATVAAILFATISTAVNNVRNTWTNIWNAISGFFKTIWNNIVNAVKGPVDRVISTVTSIKDRIFSFFSGVGRWLTNMGRDLIMGMVNGIKNAAQRVINAVSDVVNGAINWAKGVLGIRSPSRVFLAIGSDTIQGMINGLRAMGPKLDRQMGMVSDSMEAFYDQVYAAREFDVMMNLESEMAVTAYSTLENKFDDLAGRLEDIAAEPKFNIEKYETNNPAPEPASDTLPKNIRKVVHTLGD